MPSTLPSSVSAHLPDQLRRLRAEYGLSYQLLSQRSGVDVAYLYRLENGQAHRPSRDILIRIALGFGLEVEAADSLVRAAGHVPLIPPAAGATAQP